MPTLTQVNRLSPSSAQRSSVPGRGQQHPPPTWRRTRSRSSRSISERPARSARTRRWQDVPCTTIQCDEISAFCYAEAKNVPEEHRDTFRYGDVRTCTPLCTDTKIVPTWLVGERTVNDASVFMGDLALLLAGPVQLTTARRTATAPTCRPHMANSAPRSTTGCSPAGRGCRRSGATAPPSAPASTSPPSPACPTPSLDRAAGAGSGRLAVSGCRGRGVGGLLGGRWWA